MFGRPTASERAVELVRAANELDLNEPLPDPGWLERVLKKRIVIHLDTDQSLQGVLMERVEDGLILRAAKLLSDDPGDSGTPLAGETFVPHHRVVFAQLDE